MTTFKKRITIKSSKEKVWGIIADLGAIQKFHPGVSKSYYTTEITQGVGAARICHLIPSGKILETVKEWSAGNGFLLQIDVIEKAPPLKNFNGLFELSKINEQETEVSLTINYDMKLGSIGLIINKLIIQSKMEEGIEVLLKGLQIHSESGLEIKDVKTLNSLLNAA